MDALEALWRRLEQRTLVSAARLVSSAEADVAVEAVHGGVKSYDVLLHALRKRAEARAEWDKRRADKVYRKLEHCYQVKNA